MKFWTKPSLSAFHHASLQLLEEVGIEFRDDEALSMWREVGADVRGSRVHISGDLLMSLVAKAPSRFTVLARNPERNCEIGGNKVAFAPTYGSPFVYDLKGSVAMAPLRTCRTSTSSLTCRRCCTIPVPSPASPVDIAVPKRHLHITYSAIKHSDKPFMGPVTAPERAADAVRMAELVFGANVVDANPVMLSIMNCNSPLVWDETMLGAMKVYARANQACIIAPFVMAGAKAPASSAAAVAQLNAEALAGIAFTQICRPGAPVIYGHFVATISMRSGAPLSGTPEMGFMNLMIGQLARKYDVPIRSSGMMASSKKVDAQAAYEGIQTMYPVFLAGTNYVMHSCGWDESGLAASFAKFVLDCEQIEMFYRFGQGPQFDDFDEAVTTIREVGPGGHYLGTDHTQKHFQTAFYMPELADANSYEQWLAEGQKDATDRAVEKVGAMLESYQPPALDPAIDQALLAFIEEREAVLPDSVE